MQILPLVAADRFPVAVVLVLISSGIVADLFLSFALRLLSRRFPACFRLPGSAGAALVVCLSVALRVGAFVAALLRRRLLVLLLLSVRLSFRPFSLPGSRAKDHGKDCREIMTGQGCEADCFLVRVVCCFSFRPCFRSVALPRWRFPSPAFSVRPWC